MATGQRSGTAKGDYDGPQRRNHGQDFKPEQPVKVLVLAGDRALGSQTVELDAKGQGTARLTLSSLDPRFPWE